MRLYEKIKKKLLIIGSIDIEKINNNRKKWKCKKKSKKGQPSNVKIK